jgi:hypothetical protein
MCLSECILDSGECATCTTCMYHYYMIKGDEDDQSEIDSLLDEANIPCPKWSRGDGSCRFGDTCKYSHDGPKGGEVGSQSEDSTDSKRPKGQSNKSKKAGKFKSGWINQIEIFKIHQESGQRTMNWFYKMRRFLT